MAIIQDLLCYGISASFNTFLLYWFTYFIDVSNYFLIYTVIMLVFFHS